MKKFNYTRGLITNISELEQIRRPKNSDIFKRYISVKIHNTHQSVHLEIRNSGLKLIEHLDLDVGSEILFTYEFQAVTVKKDTHNLYINNVLLTQIKKYTPNAEL